MPSISKKFVDVNPNFTRHPVTGDIGVLKNEDAIKQSVKNIVMTQLGEKFFDPLFGTSSNGLLFENFNSIVSDRLALEIEDAIKFYEPRVTFDDIDIFEDVRNNSIKFNVNFTIIGSPLDQQSISLILEKV
jgi:phage baseplate assembly protein W|tara:strand:+ start:2824 stop:3216 length:393 start_codon:yes stop_codon:yes gene_type:complete